MPAALHCLPPAFEPTGGERDPGLRRPLWHLDSLSLAVLVTVLMDPSLSQLCLTLRGDPSGGAELGE